MVLSVDMDNWYHCRWATGAPRSRWKSIDECLAGRDRGRVAREFEAGVEYLLCELSERGVKATFFVLQTVALQFKNLIRRIDAEGHEIASHGKDHVDYRYVGRDVFISHIRESKSAIEQITGKPLLGYRAPNMMTDTVILEAMQDMGFLYDSSVCPSRPLFGKYQNYQNAPQIPYRPCYDAIDGNGERLMRLWELPVPTLPILKIPACTMISCRTVSLMLAKIALRATLARGYGMFYLHPYELNPGPVLPMSLVKARLFMRRAGPAARKLFSELIDWVGAPFITAAECAKRCGEAETVSRQEGKA
jgi:peptidoglycan/xylan/chitin deacetylase (PgdA/CDA1 family)